MRSLLCIALATLLSEPESDEELTKRLKAIEAKTQAEIESLRKPSSFAETPRSFAQVQEKLERLQAETKAHLRGANEQLAAMKDHYAVPSSFLEAQAGAAQGQAFASFNPDAVRNSFAAIQGQLQSIDEQTQQKLEAIFKAAKQKNARFPGDDGSAAPSSLLETPKHTWKAPKIDDFVKQFEQERAQKNQLFGEAGYEGPSSAQLEDELTNEKTKEHERREEMRSDLEKIDKQLGMKEILKKHHITVPKLPTSLLQEEEEEHTESFEELQDKMQKITDEANDKIRAVQRGLKHIQVPAPPKFDYPSSLLQEEDVMQKKAAWRAGLDKFEQKMALMQKKTEAEFKAIPAALPAASLLQTGSVEAAGADQLRRSAQ